MNRTRICLDGADGKEALPSYIAGIDSLLAWCRANGTFRDVSRVFGPNSVVFTTPPHGTFYVDLESRGRFLELLINGRDLYVMGFRGPSGSFEIKSDTEAVNYMIGEDVRTIVMSSNYGQLIPEGEVGYTRMGIYEFRRAFDKLFDYRGGSPGTIKESIGKIAVNISEATQLQGAFDTVCASFEDPSVSRFHDGEFDTLWVNRYGHYCEQGMIQIAMRMSGLVPEAIKIRDIEVESAEEIWRQIRVFHYDAYDQGIFTHGPNPKPKPFREEPGKAYAYRPQGLEIGNWIPGRWGNSKHAGKGAAGKNDHPPSRKYMTSAQASSSSSSPPELNEWQDCMERSNRARDLQTAARRWQRGVSALNPMSAQVSDWLAHFPALRKLCKVSYEMRKHERRALSFQTTAPQQDNFQRLTFAKLCNAKTQCKAPALSWLPTPAKRQGKLRTWERHSC